MFSAEVGASSAGAASSVRSISDWKKASMATQGRAIQRKQRGAAAAAAAASGRWCAGRAIAAARKHDRDHDEPRRRARPARRPRRARARRRRTRRSRGCRAPTSSVCLISEKAPRAILGLQAELVFQRLLEEFQRRQVARAQAQAFQVEHCTKVTSAEQRDREQVAQDDSAASWLHPFDQPSGRPSFARQRFSARAICAAIGFVIQPSRCSTPCSIRICDFVFDGVAEFTRLRAGAAQRDRNVAQEAVAIALVTGNESTSVA